MDENSDYMIERRRRQKIAKEHNLTPSESAAYVGLLLIRSRPTGWCLPSWIEGYRASSQGVLSIGEAPAPGLQSLGEALRLTLQEHELDPTGT